MAPNQQQQMMNQLHQLQKMNEGMISSQSNGGGMQNNGQKMRNNLHSAADNVSNAVTSLVREINTGT